MCTSRLKDVCVDVHTSCVRAIMDEIGEEEEGEEEEEEEERKKREKFLFYFRKESLKKLIQTAGTQHYAQVW